MTSDDASEFHAIRLRAFREHAEAFGTSYETQLTTPLEEVEQRLKTQSTIGDNAVFGCFVDDRLVGIVGFARSRGSKERHKGWIWGMYVTAEKQGKGYGRALLSHAIDHARTVRGIRQIHLSVTIPNVSAQALYRRMGFESYGIEPDALYVDGVYYSEEMMILRLDS